MLNRRVALLGAGAAAAGLAGCATFNTPPQTAVLLAGASAPGSVDSGESVASLSSEDPSSAPSPTLRSALCFSLSSFFFFFASSF